METMEKTTEDIVRESLGNSYGVSAINEDAALVAGVVNLLENPVAAVLEDSHGSSHAASEIRARLWSRFSGGVASAQATTDLFSTLGRQEELGWV